MKKKKIVVKVLSVVVFGLFLGASQVAIGSKACGLGSLNYKKMESRNLKPDDIEL